MVLLTAKAAFPPAKHLFSLHHQTAAVIPATRRVTRRQVKGMEATANLRTADMAPEVTVKNRPRSLTESITCFEVIDRLQHFDDFDGFRDDIYDVRQRFVRHRCLV